MALKKIVLADGTEKIINDNGIAEMAIADASGNNIENTYVKSTETRRIYVQDTAPSDASEGDIWIDTSSL